MVGFVGVQTSREEAFASFYQENIHHLTRTLSASLGDPQIAQDAAQEAMARACERWNKIENYDNPAGWCYRVAMNWVLQTPATKPPARSKHALATDSSNSPPQSRTVLPESRRMNESSSAVSARPNTCCRF